MGRTVYTLGHSNRSLSEFIGIVEYYGIGVVVDVRRFPKSSRYPHFSREVLEESLRCRGVEYVWLGDELGGYRTGGYLNYMKSEKFRRGFQKLISIIESSCRSVVVMCSERLWFKCHRRFIANELAKLGYTVVHIIDTGKTSIHKVKNYLNDQ